MTLWYYAFMIHCSKYFIKGDSISNSLIKSAVNLIYLFNILPIRRKSHFSTLYRRIRGVTGVVEKVRNNPEHARNFPSAPDSMVCSWSRGGRGLVSCWSSDWSVWQNFGEAPRKSEKRMAECAGEYKSGNESVWNKQPSTSSESCSNEEEQSHRFNKR